MSVQYSLPAPWAPPQVEFVPRPPRPAKRTAARRAYSPILQPGPQRVFPAVWLWDFRVAAKGKGRKCSPLARARTVRITRRQANAARTLSLFDLNVEKLRPKNRSECVNGPRPCPWMSCRAHTAISVDPETGKIKETFPELRIVDEPDGPGLDALEEIVGTCTHDIAARHDDGTGGHGALLLLARVALSGKPLGQTPGMTIQQTGEVVNLSVERVRQLSSLAIQEVRIKLLRATR